MSEYDITGDGILDTSMLDVSGDGIGDTYTTDLNQDGLTDVISIDHDQSGVAELTALDAGNDGVIDGVAVDLDEDGVAEAYAADLDHDGPLETYGYDVNEDGVVDQQTSPGSTPVANVGVGADGSIVMGSPWADSPLPDLSNPAVVDDMTGPFGDDIMADLKNGPAHSGGTIDQPVDGVNVATGLGQLGAAEVNTAGTAPAGTTVEYDSSMGRPTYYEPGDPTPNPVNDGNLDGS